MLAFKLHVSHVSTITVTVKDMTLPRQMQGPL